MSLMAEKLPPGLSSDRYVVVSHPTWVYSLLLVGTQEAAGLAGKHEGPQPLHRGKSPSEPPVNLDARAALLCQSHQPCVSKDIGHSHPTEPPLLTPVVIGMQPP